MLAWRYSENRNGELEREENDAYADDCYDIDRERDEEDSER